MSTDGGCVLDRTGYRMVVAHGDHDEAVRYARIVEDLTMVPETNFSVPRGQKSPSFDLYIKARDYDGRCVMTLPKYYGLSKVGLAHYRGAEPDEIDVPFEGALRSPDQTDPVAAFLESARDPLRRGGIVSLPCGGGKTVIALRIISELRVKTLVIAHKEFLLSQWRDRIAHFLPSASVGVIKAKAVDVEGRDIVLGSVQSLSMKSYDESVFKGFGLVVVDECHRIGTEVFSKAMFRTSFKYSLGLSATVRRKDGLINAFVYFIGKVVYSVAATTADLRADVIVASYSNSADKSYSKEEMFMSGGKSVANMSKMINNICQCRSRTAEIVSCIGGLLARTSRKILVLSDRKAQLQDIRDSIGPDVAGCFWGGMNTRDLAESSGKRLILATYPYASEGMDVPDLDTLVLASPKSDVEQSCGRIMRRHNANTPLIIDVVDTFSYMFRNQSVVRKKFYASKGYAIRTSESISADAPLLAVDDDV